jgi:hypothetical protein
MHIPFKAYATPDTLAHGDMVALYAGNDTPSHVATIDYVFATHNGQTMTMVTTDGERYDVPADTNRIWVAAWAPLPYPPATPTRPTYTRAQRHAARFAPMGVR